VRIAPARDSGTDSFESRSFVIQGDMGGFETRVASAPWGAFLDRTLGTPEVSLGLDESSRLVPNGGMPTGTGIATPFDTGAIRRQYVDEGHCT